MCLHVRSSVHLPFSFSLSVGVAVGRSSTHICLPIDVRLYVCLSMYALSVVSIICLPARYRLCLSVCLSLPLPVSLFVCLSDGSSACLTVRLPV